MSSADSVNRGTRPWLARRSRRLREAISRANSHSILSFIGSAETAHYRAGGASMRRARTLLILLSIAVLASTPGCFTGLVVEGIDDHATSPSARMAANVGLGLVIPFAAAFDFVFFPIELVIAAIVWFLFPPFI